MAFSSPVNAEIQEMLGSYARCYAEKDLGGICSLVSPDICGYGSGPDEVITGYDEFVAQVTRDFIQADRIALRFTDIRIHGAMPVAWIMAGATFTVTIGEVRHTFAGRMTAVLQKTDDRWRFGMVHFSMAYAEQQAGKSYPGRG
jgi:ketosteroid isomerase-like protein